MSRRRIPNCWECPAPLVPTPSRLRRANARSRPTRTGDVPHPTGTPLRRYYSSLNQLKKEIRRRARDDLTGLVSELWGCGSIYLWNHSSRSYDQLTAAQVIRTSVWEKTVCITTEAIRDQSDLAIYVTYLHSDRRLGLGALD